MQRCSQPFRQGPKSEPSSVAYPCFETRSSDKVSPPLILPSYFMCPSVLQSPKTSEQQDFKSWLYYLFAAAVNPNSILWFEPDQDDRFLFKTSEIIKACIFLRDDEHFLISTSTVGGIWAEVTNRCYPWCISTCERHSFRGFVQPAHEGRPVHHQRGRESNAGGDAHLTAELWVRTSRPVLFPLR